MNTDVAQLCVVLRSLLKAAEAGKMTKKEYTMCGELLAILEEKYEAGVAALEGELSDRAVRNLLEA